MNIKILIEKNLFLSKIAVIQDDEWIGYYLDSHLEEDLQNQVIVGQIEQIVKHLNAVFVDFNGGKNGLLHIKQIPEVYQNKLHPGSRIPVQIVKQNSGEKGNKLTGMINLSGRFLVCLPFEKGIHVSKKIQDQKKRESIKLAIQEICNEQYGFIVRTNAKDVSTESLQEDAKELIKKADHFMQTKDFLSKGTVLYKEPPLGTQIVLEYMDHVESLEIICNDEMYLNEIKLLVNSYQGTQNINTVLFPRNENMFHIYDMQKKLDELMHRKIWLKNGGNLIIDYTEAMTIIDVNSAKAIMTKNSQKAVLDLNLLAVKESILQILRRNLSGMIIIDLVEMASAEDKQRVYEYAKDYLSAIGDTHTKVFPLTELGLMQIARTKKYKSLHQQLLSKCPICNAQYAGRSFAYYMQEIEHKIREVSYQTEHQSLYLQVKPELYDYMTKNNLVDNLVNKYNLEIELRQLEQTAKNMFLCQFYKR